jgi:hypothetical protein
MNESKPPAPRYGSRDFLLKDWEAAHKSRESYASMRLGVLGACLTILGLVVTLGKDAEYPGIVGIWLVLLAVVFAAVRMLAAVNRTVYVFGLHMASIELELGEVGFAACWAQHVKADVRDTATAAHLVAIRLLNSGVTLLVAGLASVSCVSTVDALQRWQLGMFAAVALLLFLWNETYIRREFDPRRFLQRIESALRENRDRLIASRTSQFGFSSTSPKQGTPPNPSAQADGSAAA